MFAGIPPTPEASIAFGKCKTPLSVPGDYVTASVPVLVALATTYMVPNFLIEV